MRIASDCDNMSARPSRKRSTSVGTFPTGFRERCSGVRCSLRPRSSFLTMYGISASSNLVAHSRSRSRACGNRSGSGSRTQPNRGRADAPPRSAEAGVPASQIFGEVARHEVRGDGPVQIVSQPQLTPPFFHARLRILCADSFEKCFDRQLSAISRCDCSWHTARPRTCWNYGGTCHRKGSGV
jgi:hypothetical protein